MVATDLDLLRAFVLLSTDGETGAPVRLLGSSAGTAGAALLELSARGAVRIASGRVHATQVVPGDPLLRVVREDVTRRRRPPRVGTWIDGFGRRSAPALRAQVLGELLLAGIVRQRPGRRRSTEHPDVDPAPRAALEERIRAVLAGGDDEWAAVLHQLVVAAAGPKYLAADGRSAAEVLRQARRWRRERYPDEAVRSVVTAVERSAQAPLMVS